MKHVHQWLEYLRSKDTKSGSFKEESFIMDIWDFAGQHLYYASHPIFLSQRALYILVHNLSKPLDAKAEPCIRQGSNDVKLENPNNETNMENLLSWLATVHGVSLATDDQMMVQNISCPTSVLQCLLLEHMLTNQLKT